MTDQKQYTILGNSNATVSMILETIDKINSCQKNVVIVENVEGEHTLPYMVDRIKTRKIFHDQLKENDIEHRANCILGVYKPAIKKKVFEFFNYHYQISKGDYMNLFYPGFNFAGSVKFGLGIQTGPHVVIAPFTEIKNFVTINRSVSIGHHTVLEDYCTINPGVNIAGNCWLEEGVTIGMGTNIIDGVKIGSGSVIGAGSLVTKNIPAGVVAYGLPAKIIKTIV